MRTFTLVSLSDAGGPTLSATGRPYVWMESSGCSVGCERVSPPPWIMESLSTEALIQELQVRLDRIKSGLSVPGGWAE